MSFLIGVALILSGLLAIYNSNLESTNPINAPIFPISSSIPTAAAGDDAPHDFINFSSGNPPNIEPHQMLDLKSCKYYDNNIIDLSVYDTIDDTHANITNGGWYSISLVEKGGSNKYVLAIGKNVLPLLPFTQIRAIIMNSSNGDIWNGTEWVSTMSPHLTEEGIDLCDSDPNGTSTIKMDLSEVTGINRNNIEKLYSGVVSFLKINDDTIYDECGINFASAGAGIDPLLLLLMSQQPAPTGIPSFPPLILSFAVYISILSLIITFWKRKNLHMI